MRFRSLLTSGALFVVTAAQVHGQPEARARTFSFDDDDDRPMIGVSTATSGGKRDTLGLLITSVTPGGPAERAGIEEGARIQTINGVNLRLSVADAGEPDMAGVASRRLTREIRKVKVGDEVELRLWQNGAARTLRVKTIAADDLRPARSRDDDDDRAVLGISLSPTGTRRDTLGIFVSRVQPDGPAEKAGLVEGDRIAAINGVDLRVPREDAGDEFMASSKHSRFTREMRNVKAGQDVELRVYSGGAMRTVRVRAARNEDVYRSRDGFRIGWGDGWGEGQTIVIPRAPGAPRAPIAVPAPRVRVLRDYYQALGPDGERFEELGRRMAELGARLGERMSEIGPEMAERMSLIGPEINERVREALERVQAEWPERLEYRTWQDEDAAEQAARAPAATPKAKDARALEAENRELGRRLRELEARQIPRARTASAGDEDRLAFAATPMAAAGASQSASFSATGEGERFSIRLPGLRLAPVGADLASYLGEGSQRGLLVVEADDRWVGLRAGDVLMAIDGRAVSDGHRATVSLDLGRPHRLDIMRAGKRQTVTIERR